MGFTKEELEAMAAFDAEIDDEFDDLTWEEIQESKKLDHIASVEALPPEERKAKEYGEEYRRRNRDKLNARTRKYRQEHRQECLDYGKQYRELHPEYERERKKVWYRANKKKILDKQHKYYEENRQAISERRRKQYQQRKAARNQPGDSDEK